MGEVYRARDMRLQRAVAIKILPQQLSNDPVRKQRFEREAKTISSLNHPHICTLHDVGSQDGVDYLVMECVEGESLAKRLEKGPLPLEQVLKYGAQIADALDKAHRAGIVHRDLKPGNIMLTGTGAKLLDFGLAKPSAAVSGMTLTAATQTTPVTQEGTVVGTFQYMSPEQVEGKELDGRSDIFSLGAVLYEMVTGKRAFEGKSQLNVASTILEKDPAPIMTIKPMTPPALDHAIRRCLAKDPEERWQTARDVALELKCTSESASQSAAVSRITGPTKSPKFLAWLAYGALAAVLLMCVLWLRRPRPLEQTMHFSAPFGFAARDMAVAPNGHTVAVVGSDESGKKTQLWLYEVGSQRARGIADTTGASFPFWSPDEKFLGFFAAGKLKKLNIADGTVQTLCDAPSGRGGSWNRDGVIIFTPTGQLDEGLYRISASGGTPTGFSFPDKGRGESSHRWPVFLPDGKHFLYLAFNVSLQDAQGRADSIFVGALDSAEKKFVTKAPANAGYAAPGYLLYFRDNMLFAQRFDANKFELTGEATPVLNDIQFLPRIGRAVFAASGNGLLVAQSSSGVSLSQLVWSDRKGDELSVVGKPDVYANVSLAPDGKSLALDKTDIAEGNPDVWIYGLERGSTKRLTFNPAIDAMPVWSPDEKRLIFSSSRQQSFDLYLKNADGAAEEKLIEHSDVDKFPCDWSHDGQHLLYVRGPDLWVLSFPEMKSSPFLKAPSTLKNAQFSPDGKWVAYASNESGKWEIYATSFPEAKGKWQVSSGGGEQPRWRSDGKELFYLSPEGKIMAAPVRTGANFDVGAPVALFQANPRELVATSEHFVYDVSKDGQRFLINTQVKNPDTRPMSVVLNWDAELKKK
jgi:Tol biopolymer transport system component